MALRTFSRNEILVADLKKNFKGGHDLKTGQIAKVCAVAPRTVSAWIDTNQLRGHRLAGSLDRRVSFDSLLDFLSKSDPDREKELRAVLGLTRSLMVISRDRATFDYLQRGFELLDVHLSLQEGPIDGLVAAVTSPVMATVVDFASIDTDELEIFNRRARKKLLPQNGVLIAIRCTSAAAHELRNDRAYDDAFGSSADITLITERVKRLVQQ